MTLPIQRFLGAAVVCAAIGMHCGPLAAAQSMRPPHALSSAIDAAEAKDWAAAFRLAARNGEIARDMVEWHRLRAGEGSPAEVLSFLDRHGDWPGIAYLRKQSEKAFAENASPDQTNRFFQSGAPQTAWGAFALARAYEAAGNSAAAHDVIRSAWRTMSMEADLQAAYEARYAAQLKDLHEARLDMLLWEGARSDAGRMLVHVSEGWRALAAARIALQSDTGDVNALINAVPSALQGNAGLAHDRYQWRIEKGYTDSARDLLLERSASADLLGRPENWANWRRILTRREMREGSPAVAYRIASTHGLTAGSDWADLEWLSGYIALRQLNDPARALEHFKNLNAEVESPISKGRAGYWIGRAYEALGDTQAARKAYEAGGLYQTSFYGLLAAEKAGLPFDISLAGGTPATDWRHAGFVRSTLFHAAVLLIAADERVLAERFIRQMAETLPEAEVVALGDAMIEMNEPHLAVMVGKDAASRGMVVPRAYYALHPIAKLGLPIEPEFALAIARRESEFDPSVVSPVGARGLMQLMPATAEAMAKKTSLPFNLGALTRDPIYNARLGSAYLAKLKEDFQGNPIMMSAGYNAGPSRPERWIEQFGDPRRGAGDIVDWIEMIPFRETRNYVMRVTESLPIYRARLGLAPLPVPFSQEIAK
ncbi:MAG: lytic transglycosylase domain-containing protein [Pseudomonadota bacterium]|nr:lytic transglycosylase domain-containing protein [Pseudomonadota bacterium]